VHPFPSLFSLSSAPTISLCGSFLPALHAPALDDPQLLADGGTEVAGVPAYPVDPETGVLSARSQANLRADIEKFRQDTEKRLVENQAIIVGFTTVVDIPHSTSVEVALSILYIISIL
jgi:hypothetical protein